MKDIPVLYARGKSLAEAYENALMELYKNGGRIKTQYDKKEDPPSVDATLNITIEEPLSDPMIHRGFPGGIYDLREYVYELEGLKDGWTRNLNDPKDTRWDYTYSQRLKSYGLFKYMEGYFSSIFGMEWDKGKSVNQIEAVVNKLIKDPYTRRAQMITWIPILDADCYDPPCAQSFWFRITQEDKMQYLNTNVRFRSNDAWGAYFMNSFGFTQFIKEKIVDEYTKRTGKLLAMGRINWQADSWHIYGKDIKQFEERFYNRLPTTKFEDRVYNFFDPEIQEMYHECEKDILKKINEKNEEYKGK